MDPRKRALAIAGVALVLLVVVIGVDVSMDRTIALDFSTSDGWVTLAQEPFSASERIRYSPPPSVDANGSATFRLVVENEYPWAYSRAFVARSGATVIAEGTLDAPAGGRGVATFTVNASALRADMGPGRLDPPREESAPLHIEIGSVELYASVVIRGGG